MRILIDIGHPGHVHLFRPFAVIMQKKGHKVLFTCREKEFEIDLLKATGFQYKSFGKKYKNIIGKIWGLIKFDVLEVITALQFKPDVFLSHGSPYAAHAAWLTGKPHISMEDTGNNEQVKLYLPFTKHVLTSTAFHKNYGEKQIRYSGFHEMAYLHPNRFKFNKDEVSELKLVENEKLFLLRFVSWNASHDVGEGGLTLNEKAELVEFLNTKGKVLISSEKELPDTLKKYQLKLHPSKVHQLMAYTHLFIGEGATMASECAVLGTPAVYVNSMEAGTIDEQEKAGLVYHFRNGKGVIEKVKELVADSYLKLNTIEKRDKFLKTKIDLTAFLVWFVEQYPQSPKILKENPSAQDQFMLWISL